ncbi:hypothetical protein FA15DRAFT_129272 [Coprinopsis marcescibilis]|uniref:Uncharacterized protein n=1 Tax=Coprinopsis marcescibilis TaxID=230819 RepID=A0A5C3KJN5_COPMA|nr:hypothetical protein FA15DRAFT_129272 [Coprinopsis marcescibilis]
MPKTSQWETKSNSRLWKADGKSLLTRSHIISTWKQRSPNMLKLYANSVRSAVNWRQSTGRTGGALPHTLLALPIVLLLLFLPSPYPHPLLVLPLFVLLLFILPSPNASSLAC